MYDFLPSNATYICIAFTNEVENVPQKVAISYYCNRQMKQLLDSIHEQGGPVPEPIRSFKGLILL